MAVHVTPGLNRPRIAFRQITHLRDAGDVVPDINGRTIMVPTCDCKDVPPESRRRLGHGLACLIRRRKQRAPLRHRRD